MKNRGFFLGVMVLFCIITLISCKNDEERLGLASNSNNPEIIVIDTFTVITRTVKDDSLLTSRLSLNQMGALNSSVYGKSNANLVLNFALPPVSNFSFPAGSHVDSVFLVLEYAGATYYNGDITTPLTINANELTERIFHDSVYYSNRTFSYDPAARGTYNGTFRLADSVKVTLNGTTTTQAPQLRIRLDNTTFGNRLVTASPASFASNSAFQDFIQGFRVSVDNTGIPTDQGAVVFLNPLKGQGVTGLHVFYNDTSFVQFPVNDVSAVTSTYSHDFMGTPIQTQITTPGNYNTGYLQSMAGTKLQVLIPGLQNIALENYAIVGANLVFSADVPAIGVGFAAPPRMLLFARDTTNTSSLVLDAVYEPALYDGNYNSSTGQYMFNMPRHLQFIYSEYKKTGINYNNGFYLRIPADNPITASRLTADTQKGTSRGVKFKLHVIKVR